ncbi:MAG: DMT family transporter [Pseudomonadota bacterium]
MKGALGMGLGAYAPVMVTVTLWSFQIPALHHLGMRWDPATLNVLRYIIAAAAFLAIAAMARRSPAGPTQPPLGPLRGLGLGALFAGFGLLFTVATTIGDPIMVVTAAALMPLTASLVNWVVLGTPPSMPLVAALFLVVPGAALTTPAGPALEGDAAGWPVAGLLLILLAQAVWSLYSLSVQRWLEGHSNLARTRLSVLWSIPYHALVFVLAAGLGLLRADAEVAPMTDGILIVAITLGPLVLGVMLWNLSVTRIGLPVSALFLNLVPVLGVGVATLFGSTPDGWQLLGVALVILGMGAAQYRRRDVTEGRPTVPRA